MSKVVKIPDSMSPFVVIVNGVKHTYPSGVEMEVPDNVAAIIEGYEKGNFPQPAVPATVINMISPGGKQFELTISDDGELKVIEKKAGNETDLITFTVNGNEYQAEEGMTWGEWVESDYNHNLTTCLACGKTAKEFVISVDGAGIYSGTCNDIECDSITGMGLRTEVVTMNEENNFPERSVSSSEPIIAGCAYETW